MVFKESARDRSVYVVYQKRLSSYSSCIFQLFSLEFSFSFLKAIKKYESAVSVSVDWKQVHHVCYWELMWCNR